MIPRLTHQTAATRDVRVLDGPGRTSLLRLHPDWTHRFYDDADCRALVGRALPHLLPVYEGYSHAIQRADLFRIAAVYADGGFYLDTDVVCKRPLDELLGHGLALGVERTLGDAELREWGHDQPLRIANYMFASRPRHPFWLDVLEAMAANLGRPITNEVDILESTGPGLLTRVFHRVRGRYPDLAVIENPGLRCAACGGVCCQFGAFASHLHAGSWRWQAAARAAPNDELVLLDTYGDRNDGLSSVLAQLAPLGRLERDTRTLVNRRVVVVGVPLLFRALLSPENTNVLLSMFESTELPLYWASVINEQYRACIVPHEWVRNVFARSGVRVPIAVNQLGYTRLPHLAVERDGAFRVGFLGVPVLRKNLAKLVEACSRLRRAIPSLRLAIHVSHLYASIDRSLWEDVRHAPFVEWSEGTLSDQELGAWFARLSCYVYPSSAEGWSFTPREALALGVPTALSRIPVHQELVDSGFCTVIETSGPEPAAYEGGTCGEWERVESEEIERAIARIHADPDGARERAERGARWIEGQWVNADSQRRFAELLARVPPA